MTGNHNHWIGSLQALRGVDFEIRSRQEAPQGPWRSFIELDGHAETWAQCRGNQLETFKPHMDKGFEYCWGLFQFIRRLQGL